MNSLQDNPRSKGLSSAELSAMIFILAVAAALTTIKLFDADTFIGLAEGKMMLGGVFPGNNHFAHTAPDHPFQHAQWLFSVLLALLERTAGIEWVNMLTPVVLLSVLALTFRNIKNNGVKIDWRWSVPLIALALVAIRFRYVPRAHLASDFGLALMAYMLSRKVTPPLWAYALLAAVWSNLHAGVVFGTALISLYTVGAFFEGGKDAAKGPFKVAIAFALGSLINPYIIGPYKYVVDVLFFMAEYPFKIGEYQPPTPDLYLGFFLLSAISIASIAWLIKRRRFSLALPAIFFLAMSYNSLRIIPQFIIIMLPVLLVDLDTLAKKSTETGKAWIVWVMPVFLLCTLGTAIANDTPKWKIFRTPGFGVDWTRLPASAADFVEQQGLTGNLFNEYAHGGFLMWRFKGERQIMVDGRVPAYPRSFFEEYYTGTQDGFTTLLDKYKVDYAIVDNPVVPGQRDRLGAFLTLGWQPVYQDGATVVFVRQNTSNAAKTASLTFKYLMPVFPVDYVLKAAEDHPAEVRAELARIAPQSQLKISWVHTLGIAASYAGDAPLSVKFFERALTLEPKAYNVMLDYADALVNAKNPEQARKVLETVQKECDNAELKREAGEMIQEYFGR